MKKIVILLILQAICLDIFAQEVQKETHLYSIKEKDTLRFDRYYVENSSQDKELKPAIIFVFGGAFYVGKRDEPYFIPCFEYYAKAGYDVFSIDYRLGLKGIVLKSVKPVSRFISIVGNAIDIAVEDLYDATSYIVGKSKEWNIDPTLIIPFGSSAGAITTLHAEYYRVNGHHLTSKLPRGFEYGGIISMAGAIFSTSGKISWNDEAAPILMFQGSADRNVPYDKMTIFKYGFYGSKSVAKSLKKIESPYYFYTFAGAGHEMAGLPMNKNRDDINDFLTKLVKDKQPFEITKTAINTSKPKIKEKFKMKDYIKANFSPGGFDLGRFNPEE